MENLNSHYLNASTTPISRIKILAVRYAFLPYWSFAATYLLSLSLTRTRISLFALLLLMIFGSIIGVCHPPKKNG